MARLTATQLDRSAAFLSPDELATEALAVLEDSVRADVHKFTAADIRPFVRDLNRSGHTAQMAVDEAVKIAQERVNSRPGSGHASELIEPRRDDAPGRAEARARREVAAAAMKLARADARAAARIARGLEDDR